MHRLHVTRGIVLGKRGVGEANTLVAVLTEDLGLLRASARSTRIEVSKLRYGLEPLSRARYSFIEGRHEWKITGVEGVSRELIGDIKEARMAAGRIAKLLLRLVRGEEEGRELFDTVLRGLLLLSEAGSVEKVASIECILVLRVLSHLGYLPRTAALLPFVEGDFASAELAVEAHASRTFLIRTINESLMQSGL